MSNLYAHFRIRLRAVRLYLCDNEALVRVVFGPVVCCCLLAPHTGLCYAGESLLFFLGMGIQWCALRRANERRGSCSFLLFCVTFHLTENIALFGYHQHHSTIRHVMSGDLWAVDAVASGRSPCHFWSICNSLLYLEFRPQFFLCSLSANNFHTVRLLRHNCDGWWIAGCMGLEPLMPVRRCMESGRSQKEKYGNSKIIYMTGWWMNAENMSRRGVGGCDCRRHLSA